MKLFKYLELQSESNCIANSRRNPLFNTQQMKFSLQKHLQKHICLHSGNASDSEQQLYKIARNAENPKGNSTITINEERMVAGFRGY